MTLAISLFVIILWTGYRFIFPENLLIDEAIIKPLIWLLPIFIVTRFRNIGFTNKNVLKNIIIGLLLGIFLSLERLFVTKHNFTFSIFFIISSFFTALVEEIFFRGYLLSRWLKYFKSKIWLAAIFNAIFFTLTHIPIAYFQFNYRGYNLFTYLLSIFVSGFSDIFLYIFTGSIYASVANHFVWNIFSSMFK